MTFEFNALAEELASLRREVRDLKRFAPSGVHQPIELQAFTSAGTPVTFDGLNGGLSAQALRINEWAWVSYAGIITSVAGASGSFTFRLPWKLIGHHPAQYTPVGRADFGRAATGANTDGVSYVFGNVPQLGWTTWTPGFGGGQSQFTTAFPSTWAVGDVLRGFAAVHIAPGF